MFSEILLIMFLAFVMEVIDSSVGMGYGTILSPLLVVIMGYPPTVVIPSILLSQAVGGSIAGFYHHRYKNVEFKFKGCGWFENIKKGFTPDLRFVLTVTGLGIFTVISGVFVATHIPLIILKTYIGILVLIMGILLWIKKSFSFSRAKMITFASLSTFNKGMTGGGFGPVLTSGQILGGQEEKRAIGCTTLAEGPVCLIGFIAYMALNGKLDQPTYSVIIPMLIGAAVGGPCGSLITKQISREKLRQAVSYLMLLLGIWTILKIWW